MKKFWAILVTILLLAGCASICALTADRRAQVNESLHMLQAGYETIVATLQTTADPRVRVAVALTDAALDMTGKLLDKWCPTAAELALAEATTQAALEAKTLAKP